MNAPTVEHMTGVPGLDSVLGGGPALAALVSIVGPPGAGKTVLGAQMLFGAARRGLPGLILSTFSEGNVKLIDHLRALAFFDEALVGGPLTLLSLQTLFGAGEETMSTGIIRAIRQTGAKLVLIDGFQGIETLVSDPAEVRQLLAHLGTQLSYLGATLLLTVEGSAHDHALARYLTQADVIIGLEYSVVDWAERRQVCIVKQRGRGIWGGRHTYMIDQTGVTVYPRLETWPLPAARPREPGRAAFGLLDLDRLLDGGLTRCTTTLLAGAPGAGKTTLALHWALSEARPDNTTVFLSFSEHHEQLRAKAAAFGLNLDAATSAGALTTVRLSIAEVQPDVVAAGLFAAITPATRRLVVDDIEGLLRVLGPRAQSWLASLTDQLYAAGITTLCLLEIAPFAGFQLDLSHSPLSLIAENVVLIQHQLVDGRLQRLLTVLKMRFSDCDRTLHELVLDRNGIRVPPREANVAGEIAVSSSDFTFNGPVSSSLQVPTTDH